LLALVLLCNYIIVELLLFFFLLDYWPYATEGVCSGFTWEKESCELGILIHFLPLWLWPAL